MRRPNLALFLAFLGVLAGPSVAQTATTTEGTAAAGAPGRHAARLANADPAQIASRMMTRADTDRNGTVSQAEWLAAGRKARGFERMDANHDGQLDRTELAAGVKQMQARAAAKSASAAASDASSQ